MYTREKKGKQKTKQVTKPYTHTHTKKPRTANAQLTLSFKKHENIISLVFSNSSVTLKMDLGHRNRYENVKAQWVLCYPYAYF